MFFNRDRENARYLLTLPTHLFTMVLCFCMCYKNLVGAPSAFYANGRGAAVIAHFVLTLTIVLPLAHLQFALGRVTRLGPYAIFSGGSPMTRGVGMAMVGHAAVALWVNGPPMVHSLTYVFSSLQHVSKNYRLILNCINCYVLY